MLTTALWGASVAIRDTSIVDVFWGAGFVVIAWVSRLGRLSRPSASARGAHHRVGAAPHTAPRTAQPRPRRGPALPAMPERHGERWPRRARALPRSSARGPLSASNSAAVTASVAKRSASLQRLVQRESERRRNPCARLVAEARPSAGSSSQGARGLSGQRPDWSGRPGPRPSPTEFADLAQHAGSAFPPLLAAPREPTSIVSGARVADATVHDPRDPVGVMRDPVVVRHDDRRGTAGLHLVADQVHHLVA